MEFVLDWILRIAAAVGFIYIVLSLFNVHWLVRVRILASMAVGGVLLGFLLWHRIAPVDPLGAVTLIGGSISIPDAFFCFLAAFIAGAGGYLVAYPAGRSIGLLAAPTGVAIWSLLLTHSTLDQRTAVYSFLRLETLFWAAVLLFGAAGVWAAGKLLPVKADPLAGEKKDFNANRIVTMIVGIIASIVIVQFAIGLFAQNVRYPDVQLGSVIGQPGSRQIAFAVFVSFVLAGFIIKYFLDCDHYLAVIAAPILFFFILYKSSGSRILSHMTESWPVAYFSTPIAAILPIQIISFAAIGALAGHWLAVKYKTSKEAV